MNINHLNAPEPWLSVLIIAAAVIAVCIVVAWIIRGMSDDELSYHEIDQLERLIERRNKERLSKKDYDCHG